MNKIVLVLSLYFVSFNYAQYDEWIPARVILKSGDSFRGLVKLPQRTGFNVSYDSNISFGSKKVLFRKNKKSKTEKYRSKVVDEIIFGDERFATEHYQYVSINRNKSIIMERVIDGKVSLYKRGNRYYLLKDSDEVSTQIVNSDKVFFNSKVKAYFSGCKKITNYINNKLYDSENVN